MPMKRNKKGMAMGGAMKKKGYAAGGKMKKKGMAVGGKMKKKGMAAGGKMKKKGMAVGGRTTMGKQMMSKGGATMSLAKIKSAAKSKGFKLVKE